MSTKGNATGTNVIRGAVGTPKFARGASAYEVAVINGFEGTEEEWLESLKPRKGVDYFTDEDIQQMVAACLEALPAAEGVRY